MAFRIVIEMRGAARGKGKGFPVKTKYGLRIAPDGSTQKYADRLGFYAEKEMAGREPLKGAFSVAVEVRIKIPEAFSKRNRGAALAHEIFPTKKPDCDNYAKLIGDALNGIVWEDDKQIVHLTVRKVYAESPALIVTISEAVAPEPQLAVTLREPIGPLFMRGLV